MPMANTADGGRGGNPTNPTTPGARGQRGTNPGQQPVNFYFDNSGLLVRLLRWNQTLVGPIATQYDYSDYRNVSGVKRPFKVIKTSTRNQVTMVIKEYRPNVAIDATRFGRPNTTRLIK
jgi:hypothetical protein